MSDFQIRMGMSLIMSFFIIASLTGLHPVNADDDNPICGLGPIITCELGYDCRVGSKDYKSMGIFTDKMVDTLPVFENDSTIYDQYCDCQESKVQSGYAGMTDPACTTIFRRCPGPASYGGDDVICFNNAPCVLDIQENYSCDCSKISNKNIKFDGDHCETKNFVSQKCPAPAGYDSEDFYCANGGVCNGKSFDYCDCPSNYNGPRCELKIEKPKCDLPCTNTGECVFGYPNSNQYENLGFDMQQSFSDMYCQCPYGFIGLLCSIEIRVCGADEHYCLNDGACVKDDDEYTCECASGTRDSYAGKNCQHIATSFCAEGKYDSFCTNNGKCKAVNKDDPDMHPGCFCSKGFHGEYCEHGKKAATKFVWVYMILLLFIVSSIFAVLCIKHRNKKMVSQYSDANVDAAPDGRMYNVDIN